VSATSALIFMSKVTIYQYLVVDNNSGQIRKANRWGTREAIARLRNTLIVEHTATRVDDSVINIGGFTVCGFDPVHSGER
jgi:hypothetical protein